MKLNQLPSALERHAYRLGLLIITLSLLSMVFTLSGCSDDDDKKSDTRDVLLNTWVLGTDGTVVKDGSDVTDSYTGLAMTFASNGTYTTTQGGQLLESAGTWAWKGTDATAFTLDGDFAVQVVALEADKLQIRFTLDVDDLEGGRPAALAGEYEIHFIND